MFKIKTDLDNGNTAKFTLEPLEAGLGHTVGNSLRRVLLTSLEGSAITSVKIEGVNHQFSTIDGISEDVLEILLNLKKVRVSVFSNTPIKLVLKSSGKKKVTAGDFQIVGDGEIANPDAPIASLNDAKAKLNMEMIAEKGKGYSIAEERKSAEIGVIPVDALFSPIISVDYSVESTRVGRRTDYDRLTIEVTTDGTVKPIEGLNQAAKILATNFKQIYEPTDTEEKEVEATASVSDEVLKMSVEELDLPVRITNALKAIDIDTVEQLITEPRARLLKVKNLGAKSLSLISEKLSERGLSLREA